MDKEWVFLQRGSVEYNEGLRAFINHASIVAGFNGRIKCPCRNCSNKYWKLPTEVEDHIGEVGMWPNYVNAPWKEHGEKLPGVDITPPLSPHGDMPDMLHDAFGIHNSIHEAAIDDEVLRPQGSIPDIDKFFRLVKEAETELYPGCGRTKLSFLVRLYKVKCLSGWTDASMSLLLSELKDWLPLVGTSLMQRKKMVLVIKSLIKCYAIFPWVHEKLIFNTAGQAVAPRYKVAKYSRYIGMLATDPSIFPINVKDYRTLRKLGQVVKAWKIVKDSIDWGYDENRAKEERIKKTVEKKLNDRWRKFKYVLHQEYYLPFIGDPERFECDDGRADSGQYQKLVDIWDEGGYSEKRSATNIINRKQLRVCHTAGSMTFAQMRYEWELEHPGQVLDRSTFFKFAHTKKGKGAELSKAINEEAQQHFDMLALLEQREYEAGKELTPKLKDQLFAEHFGPETQNGVRGYGIGVQWQDVPGVVTKNKGISHQVQELRDALEIANNKHEEAILVVELAKAEMDKMKEATNLKEQKLEDLNSIKRQLCAVSPLAAIFEGGGLESITPKTLQSLITLLFEAARQKGSSNNNSCFNMQGSADSMVAL